MKKLSIAHLAFVLLLGQLAVGCDPGAAEKPFPEENTQLEQGTPLLFANGGQRPLLIQGDPQSNTVFYWIADDRGRAASLTGVFMDGTIAQAEGVGLVVEDTAKNRIANITGLAQMGKSVYLVGFSNGVTSSIATMANCQIYEKLAGAVLIKGRVSGDIRSKNPCAQAPSRFKAIYSISTSDRLGYGGNADRQEFFEWFNNRVCQGAATQKADQSLCGDKTAWFLSTTSGGHLDRIDYHAILSLIGTPSPAEPSDAVGDGETLPPSTDNPAKVPADTAQQSPHCAWATAQTWRGYALHPSPGCVWCIFPGRGNDQHLTKSQCLSHGGKVFAEGS